MNDEAKFVDWDESLETGIPYIDNQHRELVSLANQLYQACVTGDEKAESAFLESMHKMVDYVRFHFSAEQELLKKIKYPKYKFHASEHDSLIKKILGASKIYHSDKKSIPNDFVDALKEWVFSHIAITDRAYAVFVAGQLKEGLISEEDLEDPNS